MYLKLVAFNGPPGSGKDTGADAVQAIDGLKTIRKPLAEELKSTTCRFFGTPEPWQFYENMKDKPNKAFREMTPRQAYIWMSEEVIKPKFGRVFFSKALIKKIENAMFSVAFRNYDGFRKAIVVSDVGFDEEWAEFRYYFGVNNCLLIQTTRPNHDFSNDSRNYIVEKYGSLNIHIINNDSDIPTYTKKVQSIVADFIRD